MKFQKIATLLGLTEISLKTGLFGGKPFTAFNEEQLEMIDTALAAVNEGELREANKRLNALVAEHDATIKDIENAVTAALEVNALEAVDSIENSIALLGEKCKEYGEKKSVHTISENNGEEADLDEGKLLKGYIDPEAEHNKLIFKNKK